MALKHKALLIALLLLVLGGAFGGCSSQLGGKSGAQIVKAEDGGEEEVLSEDEDEGRDEFGRPRNDGADGPRGALVGFTYLTMSIGAALLPFLFLL